MKMLIGLLIAAACIIASAHAAEQIPDWAQGNNFDECIISNVTYTYGNGTPYDVVTYGIIGKQSNGSDVCYIPRHGSGGKSSEVIDDSGGEQPVDVPEFNVPGAGYIVLLAGLTIIAMREEQKRKRL